MSIPVDVPANAAAAGGGAGGGASSSNPPPAPPPATQLAPGFRFHPTDEELVRYYLKRKVSGRELRVDAIAEVDLYKCEPWDLPSRSRIRSRDMEWYFFSPLDRKYANKSRTNRATSHGYWKTTGKDRPVKQGPRTVGMKKTLVFHAGRAPRGERTNWVMHEYRLDDEELARAGVAQDAYVVCRIFQKSGAGPQNGAQYGAPFIEEEWEEDEGMVMMRDGDDDELNDAVGHEYLQLADFVPNQDVDNQQEKAAIPAVGSDKAAIPAVGSDRQDNGSQPEDAVILLEEILSEPTFVGGDELGFVGDMVDELGFVGDMVEYPTQPLQQAGMVISDMGENTDIADCSCGPPSGSNEYMELTDFVDAGNADYPLGEDSIGPIFRTSYDQKSVNDINLGEMFDIEEFFNTSNENMDQPELSQMHPTSQDNTYMLPGHQLKPLPGDHPSDQLANDNLVFYDAPNGDLAFTEDNIVRLNDVLPSPVAQSSVENFDTVDEWMAYFDATDDFHYDTTNTFMEESRHLNPSILDHLNNTEEVNTNHVLTNNAAPQASGANNANGASTSARSHEFDSQYNSKNDKATFAPDIQRNYSDDKTITKRLVNMLGSISAPPALAAEFPARSEKSVGQVSAMHSAGSTIHFTAGMIQIHGLTLTGSAEHWSLQKNEDVGVLLSYSMAANDVVGKSAGFEPITKMQGGAVSMVLRGGFCLFFLSALILTVSYKVGICICSR